MRRRSIADVLTGAVVLLVAAAFLGYAVANSGRTATSGYTLQARFDHIDGLGVGADVRLAGVKVGSVNEERIDPRSFQAVVALSVRNDLKLPKDSAAIVTSESLLGGKYLSLQAGGDETMLQPGETITITQSSVSLEELLGKFIFSIDQREEGWRGRAGSAEANDPPSPHGLAATRRRRRCPAARSCACWRRTTPNWRQALQDAFEDAVLMGVDEQRDAPHPGRDGRGPGVAEARRPMRLLVLAVLAASRADCGAGAVAGTDHRHAADCRRRARSRWLRRAAAAGDTARPRRSRSNRPGCRRARADAAGARQG